MTWARNHKLLAAVVAVCIVAFVWSCCEVMTVFYAETSPTVDSRAALRSLTLNGAGVTVEQGEAAWSLLAEVFDAVDEVAAELNAMYDAGEFEPRDEWDLELDYGRVRQSRTVPVDLEPERHAITLLQDRGVFDKLRRFSGGPPGLRPITGEGPLWSEFRDDDRSRARNLGQLLASAMRLAVSDGDFARAAAAFDQTLALARAVAWQLDVLDYLTAEAMANLAMHGLRFELMELDFDERSCRALLESIDRHATSPGVAWILQAERVVNDDLLQWCYSDDGAGDGYWIAAPAAASVSELSDQSLFGATMGRFFYATRAQAAAGYDEDKDSARLLRHLLPQSHRKAGTRIMVMLQLHRLLHGGYPASLDEMADEPPADPLHGLPFGYRLLEDDPDGRGYLLYSIGLDRTDDGGVEVGPGASRWLAVNDPDTAGSDFVINKPRQTEEE